MARRQWREAYSMVEDRILRLETEAGSTPFFGKGVVLKDKLLIQRASNLEIYNRTDGKLIFKSDDIENLKDICVLSKYKVACLFGNKIAIWYMDSTDNLKLIKTFDLRAEFDFGCDSVAKWNSDKLIVSGKKYINEINGMVFWCIVSIKNESIDSIHDICGVRYYDGVTKVAVKHNNIFVSVHSYTSGTQLEGVYAFDALNPQKLMFLYQHNELLEPWTIMADKNYVYVFNDGSQHVHQVTHSGYLVTIHTLSSSFDKIFYDDKHEDFYTTKNKSNVITVYKNIISRCRKEYPQEAGIPVEILNMGDKSIKLFEDALKEGKEAIYNIRIMVVGHMGVGKTTLVKRLLGENVNISKRLTTEGIDIHVNCCDISLSNKTWMRKEKGSENDFKLQRIAKIVNSHYKNSGGIVEPETYDISLPKENPRQNQGDIVINDDKNITNQNQLSQHCIDQDLSSTTLYQRGTTSTDDKGSYSLSSESMMAVKVATLIRAPEFYKTNPLREMLQLLQENQNKDKLDERKDAYLTIWDFAGQCAFYTTHQMFLTRRAIYLLVADVSGQIDDDVEDDSYFDIGNIKCQVKELVNIWMNSIHSIATCEADDLNSASSSTTSSTAIAPPVILVGTHIDQIQTVFINSI